MPTAAQELVQETAPNALVEKPMGVPPSVIVFDGTLPKQPPEIKWRSTPPVVGEYIFIDSSQSPQNGIIPWKKRPSDDAVEEAERWLEEARKEGRETNVTISSPSGEGEIVIRDDDDGWDAVVISPDE